MGLGLRMFDCGVGGTGGIEGFGCEWLRTKMKICEFGCESGEVERNWFGIEEENLVS